MVERSNKLINVPVDLFRENCQDWYVASGTNLWHVYLSNLFLVSANLQKIFSLISYLLIFIGCLKSTKYETLTLEKLRN